MSSARLDPAPHALVQGRSTLDRRRFVGGALAVGAAWSVPTLVTRPALAGQPGTPPPRGPRFTPTASSFTDLLTGTGSVPVRVGPVRGYASPQTPATSVAAVGPVLLPSGGSLSGRAVTASGGTTQSPATEGAASSAFAEVADLVVDLTGLAGLRVTASVLTATASGAWVALLGPADLGAVVTGLRVNGSLPPGLPASPPPNTVVALPSLPAGVVASLVLNEQRGGPGDGTVNALHLTVQVTNPVTGALLQSLDLVVASATVGCTVVSG